MIGGIIGGVIDRLVLNVTLAAAVLITVPMVGADPNPCTTPDQVQGGSSHACRW